MLAALYRQIFVPGVCAAGGAVLCAGVLAVTVGDLVDGPVMVDLAVVLWVVALVDAVVLYLQRHHPTTLRTVVLATVALLTSAGLYGALRGSVVALFAGFAAVVFFALTVMATVLRADEPRATNPSALD